MNWVSLFYVVWFVCMDFVFMLPLVAAYMVYEYFAKSVWFIAEFITWVNCWWKYYIVNRKLNTCHTWIWTMVAWLGDFLTPVFLFNQERVLVSQHNGTNPICRSSDHPPNARSVNREDAEHREAPWVYYPLYLPGHLFLVVLKNDRRSAYYYTSFTLHLIPVYPKGDDWVEEEGLGNMLILIIVIFNQALFMFINPLTISFIIDLHMLQIK